jgi:hypothetical protein
MARIVLDRDDMDDLFDVCGLTRPIKRYPVHILCPALRAQVAGLRRPDLSIEETAALPLRPRAILIVENRDTGEALPDLDGVVAFAKLGKAVGMLSSIPWIAGLPCVYWSDLDTHGFECLHLARQALGNVRSVLMDAGTADHFRDLGSIELQPVPASRTLASLTPQERKVFEELLAARWGEKFRLEQERIPLSYAIEKIQECL